MRSEMEFSDGVSFGERRSGLEKKLIAVVCILVLVVIGLVVGIVVINSNKETKEELKTVTKIIYVTNSGSNNKSSETVNSKPTTEAVKDGHATSTTNLPNEVCDSAECKAIAKNLMSRINQTLNPCDGFYEYACGNWLTNTKIDPSRMGESSFTSLSEELSDRIINLMGQANKSDFSSSMNFSVNLYEKCLNTDSMGRQSLDEVLEEIFEGKWPLIDDETIWNESLYTDSETGLINEEIFSRMFQYFYQSIFQFSVERDIRNVSLYMLTVRTLNKGSFGLDWSVFANETSSEKAENDFSAYENYIRSVATIMNNDSLPNSPNLDDEINDMIEFETKLAKSISFDSSEIFTTVNESGLAQIIFDIMPKDVKIDNDTLIQILDPQGLQFVENLIKSSPIRTIVNYLYWSVIRKNALIFEEANLVFMNATKGIKELTKRNEYCANIVRDQLKYAVAGQYAKEYMPMEDIKPLKKMMDNILEAFEINLEDLDWMDNVTKARALQKVKSIVSFMAYPEWTLNNSLVDSYYMKYLDGIDKEGDYIKLTNDIQKVDSEFVFDMLNQSPNRNVWDSIYSYSPLVINAFYSPTKNTINILAGIIGGMFYESKRPMSMNYGAMGMVFGHELTHGFDDTGKQFDEIGNRINWWENKTAQIYEEHAKCLIDQYSMIHDTQADVNISGSLTLGENIADNGGIRRAFEAYQFWLDDNGKVKKLKGMEQFSSHQLFFLSYAESWCRKMRTAELFRRIKEDEHSPARYRVDFACKNYGEFSKAFKCPLGSNMNPKHKCQVW